MSSRRISRILLSGICLACATFGCDERPSVPQHLQEQQQKPPNADSELPARPTTQELVSGPYAPIVLDTLPLTLTAPSGWKVSHLGTIVMVEGFTPVDQVHIQLARRDHLKQQDLDILYAGAKKEQSEDPQSQMTVEWRDIPPLKVLERRSIGRTMTIPVTDAQGIQRLDEKGQPMVQRSTPMRWKLNVFVPVGGEFDQYELNFIGLSVEQFQTDKPFLEKIVYSVAPEGGVVPATTPSK